MRERIVDTVAHLDPAAEDDALRWIEAVSDYDECPARQRRHRRGQRRLRQATVAGVIKSSFPEKPYSRLQKYRLTDKGRAAVSSLASRSGGPPGGGQSTGNRRPGMSCHRLHRIFGA